MIATAVIALWLAAGEPPTPAPRPAPGGRLTMQIAADASIVAALEARLVPRLAAQGVEIAVAPAPSVDVGRVLATGPDDRAEAPLARAWLDGRDPDTALLLLIPRRADRVLARRIKIAAGFDEAALAEIGFIVDRAVASLLASEPIGVPTPVARAEVLAATARPAAPVTATSTTRPAVPSQAEPAARVAVHVAAVAGVAAWSDQLTSVGQVGMLAGVERAIAAARLGVAVVATLWLPARVDVAGQGVRLGGGDVHLLVNLGRRFGGWGVGRVGVGPVVVITRVEPDFVAGPGQAVEARPRTDRDLAFALSLRWDVPVARWLDLFAIGMLDVLPVSGSYTASIDGTPTTLFAPWPVRPAFAIGLTFGDAGQ